jgi:hypothetical protein
MGIFSFFKSKIDLNTNLSDFEIISAKEIFNIIKNIRLHLETQFRSEYNPDSIDIYKYYENFSKEDFQKAVKSSFKSGYFKDLHGNFIELEEGLRSLGVNIFSHALTRVKQKQLGNDLDILLKGTNSKKEKLFKQAEERKETIYFLVDYCSLKETILNKGLRENDVETFLLKLILSKANKIKQ